MNHKTQLQKHDYRNWVKGGLALKYLTDGIKDFADKVASLEHRQIIHPLELAQGQICDQCSIDTLKPLHESKDDPLSGKKNKKKICPRVISNCNCLRSCNQICPNKICDTIYETVITSHGKRNPYWKNTQIQKWATNPWEVAKCYINACGYAHVQTAFDTDVSGLLLLFENNTLFHKHLSTLNTVEKIREWRNNLFHSPDMELTDQKLKNGIGYIIAFLEDEKELKDEKCSKQAVLNIKELQTDEFVITSQTEHDVCLEAKVSIIQQKKELEDYLIQQKIELKDYCEEVKENIANKRDKAVKDIEEAAKPSIWLSKEEGAALSDRIKALEEITKTEAKLKNLTEVMDDRNVQLRKIESRKELQKKLKALYRKDYVTTSASPLKPNENNLPISDVYVTPDMNKEVGKTSRTLDKVSKYAEIFKSDEKRQLRIYIVGNNGSGKTAFCKMMIDKWCKVEEYMQSGDDDDLEEMRYFSFLFYLPLHSLRRSMDIKGMILQYYDKVVTKEVFEDITESIPEKCLILVNGLHEWDPPEAECLRDHETYGLPCTVCLEEATVVTTSRPSAPGILNLKASDSDVKIFLNGISRSSVSTFNERYTSQQTQKMELPFSLSSLDGIGLERRPLLMQQLTWMSSNAIEIGKSMGIMCSDLVNITFRWAETKPAGKKINCSAQKRPDYLKMSLPDIFASKSYNSCLKRDTEILELGKVAFYLTTRTKSSEVPLCRKSIAELGVEEDLLNNMLKIGFLIEENRFDPSAGDTHITFSDDLFLQYFAAVYVASKSKEETKPSSETNQIAQSCRSLEVLCEKFESTEAILKLESVLVMLCGLAPEMTFHVGQVLYDKAVSEKRREYINIILRNQSGSKEYTEYIVSARKHQQLVLRCANECQVSDPSREQKVPLYEVVLIGRCKRSREEAEEMITRFVIPQTVCHFFLGTKSKKTFTFDITRITTFKYLNTIFINGVALTHADLHLLAKFVTDTVTLKNVNMNCVSCSEHFDVSCCTPPSIEMPAHSQLQVLNADTKRIHFCQINTLNLEHCVLFGVTRSVGRLCTFVSFSVEPFPKLLHLKLKEISLQHEELSKIAQLVNKAVCLNSIELWKLPCVTQHKHNCCEVINLRHHNKLNTLCVGYTNFQLRQVNAASLETCKIQAVDVTFSEAELSRLLTLCLLSFSLEHDDLSFIATPINQSVSLKYLEMSGISCSNHKVDSSHEINLCHHAQLESLIFEGCPTIIVNKLNTSKLQYCNTDSASVLQLLEGAKMLNTLKLCNVQYGSDVNKSLLSMSQLEKLELLNVIAEEGALRMNEHMTKVVSIELNCVTMSTASWCNFVDSLLTLRHSVRVKRRWKPGDQDRLDRNYVKSNTTSFVIDDDSLDFAFEVCTLTVDSSV